MAKSRSEKMYKDSPRIESNEEGKKVIKKGPSKAEQESAEVNSGTDDEAGTESDQSGGGIPGAASQTVERMVMHTKHQQDHHAHDHSGAGDKKELHARHLKEMADMMKRHEKSPKGKGK